MVAESFDVIVAGVGSMGAATCYQLARRGKRVLGLERFGIPHAMGAAGGSIRMFRLAYFEHPDYVTLLRRSYQGWRHIEDVSDRSLFYRTGGIYMGRPDSDLVAGSVAAAKEHGLPHDMLTHAQALVRFPQFTLPDDFVAFVEPDAGLVRSSDTVSAYASAAMALGAQLHGHEAIEGWSASGNGVSVTTSQGRYDAEQLVIAGGAWSSDLLRELDVSLRVTRQIQGWIAPKSPERFQLGELPDGFPCWAIDPGKNRQFEGLYYGFPIMPDQPGVKIALHYPCEPCDPDAIRRDIDAADIATFFEPAKRYLPDAAGSLLTAQTCLYTNTEDGHFIIDKHPEHKNVTIGCGFSGHGFKFVPVVGEILADLAIDGESDLPIDFLGLGRFR